jgi:pantoate--beta-alanine ligase
VSIIMSNEPTQRALRLFTEGKALREFVDIMRREGCSIGFAPTMGALHAGHLSLIDAGRLECDVVVASVFVNPTQFAPHEDFDKYPRNLANDTALLASRGCDAVFAPRVGDMFPADFSTFVDVGPITRVLEGEYRPTHFRGVATVVLKLLQIVPADRAYFGRKDYQQTLVIRKMVDDLNVSAEVRVCPIVREADGLAMSSRNAYLSPDERRQAPALYRSLRLASELAAGGERRVSVIDSKMRGLLQQTGGIEVQYIAFVADGTVTPVDIISGPTTVALAAQLGKTRLIDNLRIGD